MGTFLFVNLHGLPLEIYEPSTKLVDIRDVTVTPKKKKGGFQKATLGFRQIPRISGASL